jgi:uncharacterized protein
MPVGFLKRKASRETPTGSTLKLYYASDVHGSDRCWKKFLGAGRHYKVDALVMGGDLTGKAIVPIVHGPDGRYRATFLGEEHDIPSAEQLAEFEDAVRYNGFYPFVASAQELERYRADPDERHRLFEDVIVAEARRWVEIADSRFDRDGIPVYVMAGNDDPWSVDDALAGAAHVVSAEPVVARVGEHEMISCSYANPTPWDSPRELPEDELYQRLKAMAEQLEAPERAIFNLHPPPHDTGLDTAMQLTDDFRPVVKNGAPVEVPVGSTAVRQIIEEYQPLVALHGHIHESRGAAHIGRTLCINSGSEYNSGRIHGVIVELASDRVVKHQFVVG